MACTLRISKKKKKELRHALSVSHRVRNSFRESNVVVIGRSTKVVVECVMPEFLNVVPICKLPWRA